MRLTIERMRTMVLAAGTLLLIALAVFLVAAKWKNRLHRMDLPQRLAKEIQQESRNFDYTHNFGANSKFRIRAAKAIQLKNDHIELHGVEIEIYGPSGADADKIQGDEFEYDQKSGVATAAGPVQMLLTRPAASGTKMATHPRTPEDMARATAQVQVKTSGVSFDRNSGMVSTAQRVDFKLTQGSGSAVGATFNSQTGYLTLMHAVELTAYRGAERVRIQAGHAEFDRGAQLCVLLGATLAYRDGEAGAAEARIGFRSDGSAQRLDASGGFVLTTASGIRLSSPTAAMDFDQHNQLRHGHLEGGVVMDSKRQDMSMHAIRTVHGTSPTADLDFNSQGQLRHAHLERGVALNSDESGPGAVPLRVTRTWRSPVADMDFRAIRKAAGNQVELETIHGTGEVGLTSTSWRGNAVAASEKMQADEMTGTFGAESILRAVFGTGDVQMEQTTATGAIETASCDRLTAIFASPAQKSEQGKGNTGQRTASQRGTSTTSASDIQSAELDGHVALVDRPAAKPSALPQPPLRATAGKAVFQGDGQWLHLRGNSGSGSEPRIVNGALELTAEEVDVSQQSGEAFARGDVKATWTGGLPDRTVRQTGVSGMAPGGDTFGGKGPAHVIAAQAQLNRSTGEAIFRGHARLWQQANSIAAPEIVLNQHLQMLKATTADSHEPVRAVLFSAGTPGADNAHGQGTGASADKSSAASVIRVRGSDFVYSESEDRAEMRGGVAGAVIAETATATSASQTLDLRMIPASSASDGQAQVDRMIATGHVVLSSQGRRGTGEQLVYSGMTGDYVLTGTDAAPPRMSDPGRGSVTGEALIFHSRDDSVSIEGGGHQTQTNTIAPELRGK